MKKINFKKTEANYYHLNFDYKIHQLFPELDWLLLNYQINRLSLQYQVEILSLVMMSTHSHLLIKSLKKNENYFMSDLFKALKIANPEYSLLEPILDRSQFLNTYKYIYRNPVEAGLCQNCEEYPYSSLRGLLGRSQPYSLVIDPLSLIQNPVKTLTWLNESTDYKLFQLSSKEINSFKDLS